MPNPIHPSASLRARGLVVPPVTFAYDREGFAQLAGAYSHLNSMADALAQKREALARDERLTPVGRREALADFVKSIGVEAMRKASGALDHAASLRKSIKAQMVPKGYDKTDIAGAMVRSEIRTWLRGLSPESKSALFAMDDLSPEVATAIYEAPAELSGLSPATKDAIHEKVIAASYPEQAHQARDLEHASQVIRGAVRAAFVLATDGTGVTPPDLDNLVGGDTKLSAIARAGDLLPLEDAEAA